MYNVVIEIDITLNTTCSSCNIWGMWLSEDAVTITEPDILGSVNVKVASR